VDKVETLFSEALRDKLFSGAQLIYGRGDTTLKRACFGTLRTDPDSEPVGDYTLFDIASLTKPVSTASLAMLACERGELDLEEEVRHYLPEFQREARIRVIDLLQHLSGLPAWLPLYESVRGKGWTYPQIQSQLIDAIAAAPAAAPLGTERIYSDLGFILLGFILEKVSRQRLEVLFRERVAGPLGLQQTLFNPVNHPDQASPRDIAATEVCAWRGRLLWGEVHDDNASVMGGAAGHAGLFATAGDVERFARAILAAERGTSPWINREIFGRFLGHEVFPKLGWDTVSPQGSQAGSQFAAASSVGHLAFTGCSLWLDFSDGKYLILLTNRVHPSRDNDGIKAFRPKIHDAVVGTYL